MKRLFRLVPFILMLMVINSELMAQRNKRAPGNRNPGVKRPNTGNSGNVDARRKAARDRNAGRVSDNRKPRNNNPGTVTPRNRNGNSGSVTPRNRNRNGNSGTVTPRNRNRNPGTVTPRQPRNRRPVYTPPTRYRTTPPIVSRRIPRQRYGYVRRLPNYRSRYYGTYRFHRPYQYYWRPYVTYVHSPYRTVYRHNVYWNPYSYFSYVRSSYRNSLYLNWIYLNSTRANGYYVINGYPYYVYNGYRHRYSSYDTCNYQLIDKYTHRVVRSYWGQLCNRSFDSCSIERQRMNRWEGAYRYSCVETFRDQNYRFNMYNASHSYKGGYTYDLDQNDYHYDDEYYDEYEYQGDNDYYGNDYHSYDNSDDYYGDDLYN